MLKPPVPLLLLLLLFALGALPACAAGDVTLVQDGQARSVIVVDSAVMQPALKPAPTVGPAVEQETQRLRLQASVRDLALYLEKMSGAKVEVVTAAPPAGDARTRILIGQQAKALGKPEKAFPYDQGYALIVKAGSPAQVGLIGQSDLATSYAIYDVLDRLGCRWFMPSEMGEVIPSLKTISLPEMNLSTGPGTIYRGIWYADDDYKRRNRTGGLLLNAGHALEMYITAQDREQHPDWRATIDGKPQHHRLKWSNPAVGETIADRIIAQLDANPNPSVSLSPDDGMGYDNSAEDKAMDAGDFDPNIGDVSNTDRLMVLCNRIAAKVTAKHPDVLFGMLAYANYTRPPVREKVHPNIVPQIAPITYSRAHPLNMAGVPGNDALQYLIDGWAKAATTLSYYYYGWFLAEPVAPNPMLAKWGHDVPYALSHKCQFWQPETVPNFETSMHALYLGLRLSFNPALKPEDVYRDLHEKFYGNAAAQMTAYWQFIDDVWVKTPEYSGCGFAYLRRWTPEKMAQARQLLNSAIAACQTPMETSRVRLADDSLHLFEDFMKMRYDLAEGRFTHLARDAAAWKKRVVALGEQYAPQYCFTRVPWNPATVDGAYFGAFYGLTYDDANRIATEGVLVMPQPLRQFKYLADPEKKGEGLGYAGADFDDAAWHTTDVAVQTWSTLGYHDYFKSMWYRTKMPIPATPAGKKVYLWLGATDGSAKVFVNGKHIPWIKKTKAADGSEKSESVEAFDGYCQPASFDITPALKPGQANTIAILCTRTFFNELGTGGLIAPVTIYHEK